MLAVLNTGLSVHKSPANGGWLIAIVAGELLRPIWPLRWTSVPTATILFLLPTTFWAMDVMFYMIFITFIMSRLPFQSVSVDDLQRPCWINMGPRRSRC